MQPMQDIAQSGNTNCPAAKCDLGGQR